jgi:hypothetical protein
MAILPVLLRKRGAYNVEGRQVTAPDMAYKDIQVILYRLAEQDRKLDAIHEQAVITNRRVAKLEKWQSLIEGGLAVLTILVVPLLVYVIAFAGLGPQAIAL